MPLTFAEIGADPADIPKLVEMNHVGNGVTEEEMLFVDSTDYTDDFLTDENGEIVGADGVATEESSDTDEESTPTYNDGYTYPIQ